MDPNTNQKLFNKSQEFFEEIGIKQMEVKKRILSSF